MQNRCPSSWFGRHNFQPRYTNLSPINVDISPLINKSKPTRDWDSGTDETIITWDKIIFATKDSHYVCDVCTKCGAVTKL